MTPVLVTAPVATAISLAEAKAHLRIDHADDDAMIEALIAAATAHLDGWRGVLGRCIMSQTWSVTVQDAGIYVLPMPDVTAALIDYDDGDGFQALTMTATAACAEVEVAAGGVIQFTCMMPASLLPAVQVAMKLMVELDYDRPEGGAYDALSRSIDRLVAPLRWRQL